MTSVAGIILAAGFGTRLAPLTDATPKPLLEVGGQPVVSRLVAQLSRVRGLNHITVVANARHDDQWLAWRQAQPHQPTVALFVNGVRTEVDRVGAVADMRAGLAMKPADHPDRWIVLAGDNLLEEDLGAHVEAAESADAAVVLCRDLGGEVPPGRFGEVTVDADEIVIGFREKPADPRSPLAATCSYVLPADAPELVSAYLDGGGDADSPGSFIGWLSERQRVVARALTGRYFDIGNLETLEAARAAYGLPDDEL